MPLFGKRKKRPSRFKTRLCVFNLLNATTWLDKKNIIAKQPHILLSDAADQFIGQLLVLYKDDPNALKHIELHRSLLYRCRAEGIDTAFAPLLKSQPKPDIPPELIRRLESIHSEEDLNTLLLEEPEYRPYLEQLLRWSMGNAGFNNLVQQAVVEFLNAETWNGIKQIVEQRGELLYTEVADQLFGQMQDQYHNNQVAAKHIERRRDLLRLCQVEGVEKVFSRFSMSPEPPDKTLGVLETLRTASSKDEIDALIQRHPYLAPLRSAFAPVDRSKMSSSSEDIQMQIIASMFPDELLEDLTAAAEGYLETADEETAANTRRQLEALKKARTSVDQIREVDQEFKDFSTDLQNRIANDMEQGLTNLNRAIEESRTARQEQEQTYKRYIAMLMEADNDSKMQSLVQMSSNEALDEMEALITSVLPQAGEVMVSTLQQRLDSLKRIRRTASQASHEATPYDKVLDVQRKEMFLTILLETGNHSRFEMLMDTAPNRVLALLEEIAEEHLLEASSIEAEILHKRLEAVRHARLEPNRRNLLLNALLASDDELKIRELVENIPGESLEWMEEVAEERLSVIGTDAPLLRQNLNALRRARSNMGTLSESHLHNGVISQVVEQFLQIPLSDPGAIELIIRSMPDALLDQLEDNVRERLSKAGDNESKLLKHRLDILNQVRTRLRAEDKIDPSVILRLNSVQSEEEQRALLEEHPELTTILHQRQQRLGTRLPQILQKLDSFRLSHDVRVMPQKISLCREALAIVNREEEPVLWAGLNEMLASSLAQNPYGSRVDNLELAIDHYREALSVIRFSHLPDVYQAYILSNLATTYTSRIRGDHADNIERAIHYHEEAMNLLDSMSSTIDMARTMINLANSYQLRIRGERAVNVEKALHLYEKILDITETSGTVRDKTLAFNNCGVLYINRIRGDREENIEKAINCYQKALKVCSCSDLPIDWAMTNDNLGNAYARRIRGDSKENTEQAIYYYQQALQVYTRTDFPMDWAITQGNLGTVYASRVYEHQYEDVEQAIYHFKQALQVFTSIYSPTNSRLISRNLGNLYFALGRWTEALEVYQVVIGASNELWATASSELARQAELTETAQIYTRAAYCLLRSNHLAESLMMHEHGKTRLLSEALALGDTNLSRLPKEKQNQIQILRETIRSLEAEARFPQGAPARRADLELNMLLSKARDELNSLIEKIRQDHFDFMPTGLDLSDLLTIIPGNGALVVPLITSQGSAVFVVPYGTKTVTEKHVVWLDEFKEHDLNTILTGTGDKPGWRREYFAYRRNDQKVKWQLAIDRFTSQLWDSLLGPIHAALQEFKVRQVILTPAGGLQMLPLHAAWYEINGNRRYFLDHYEVCYAPSGYTLYVSQRRSMNRDGDTALVIGLNQYSDLDVSPLLTAMSEAEAIGKQLGSDPLLDDAATKGEVMTKITGKALLHFSCHGYFAWGNTMSSALMLYDEQLTLSEIIGELDLSASRLVTLSACETGITDIEKSPDEYIGLPAGFLQAGAPAVVSSLWAIDDRSTTLLMEHFYMNHLEKGMLLPAALREAQLWLRDATRQEIVNHYKTLLNSNDPHINKEEVTNLAVEIASKGKPNDAPYASPYYWAAFTFNGA